MHRWFTGRLANKSAFVRTLTTEFHGRQLRRISIQQIVNIDNIDIKKLYVHKLRLENKLGHRSIHKNNIKIFCSDPFPFLLFHIIAMWKTLYAINGRMPTPKLPPSPHSGISSISLYGIPKVPGRR